MFSRSPLIRVGALSFYVVLRIFFYVVLRNLPLFYTFINKNVCKLKKSSMFVRSIRHNKKTEL